MDDATPEPLVSASGHPLPCLGRFDARRLLGLSLLVAQRVAKEHGYIVRRERPLAEHESLTMDWVSNRLGVETGSLAAGSTIIRILGRR